MASPVVPAAAAAAPGADSFLDAVCPEDVARALAAELEALRALGHDVGAPAPGASRREVALFVTRAVDGLKAFSRVDERVYVACGKLVHLRVRSREADLDAWLASPELALIPAVAGAVRRHRARVEAALRWFWREAYPALYARGLQSALKYEEMYLARLEHGRCEAMDQFFVRLAAAAATATRRAMALVLCGSDAWPEVFDAYFRALATQAIVPATPLMLFAGRARGSLASCYLLNPLPRTTEEAVRAITDEVAPILLRRGGVGLSLQSFNRTPSGDCTRGIMAVLKALDSMTAAINSDSERPTGVCVYVEPWHADVRAVLNMRGMLAADESLRCDNIFSCLWTPDLFFQRYQRHLDGERAVKWTLFDDRASHLTSLHGPDFAREYERLERAGLGVESLPIQDMAFLIVRSAVMTGSPFLMMKDACNRHFHTDTRGAALATSNLCTEIVQRATPGENGVCNLASVNLPACLAGGAFDFAALRRAARVAAVFVNAMMRIGNYPTEASVEGVRRSRSLGIGLQGLHTTVLALDMDMADPAARRLNAAIAEELLYGVMDASVELCERGLRPFDGFEHSRYARGVMPFDAYERVSLREPMRWDALRVRIAEHGVYNAQFVALMPTVSSSQVTESSEGFSPTFTNMFSKVTISGELLRPNLPLMETLRRLFPRECARRDAVARLERAQWSVAAAFGELPAGHPLAKFKTAFEYDQELLIDMCADRAPFVDHSQSMSLFLTEPADGKLHASRVMGLLMRAYNLGLKTGMYYCKIRKATNNGVFTGGDLVCTSCHL
ncbi:UL39 [Suid alphaherpesvirus 1]|jgi:ribonucleoside-diphosphate reductase alpha subunit|uniref:Ribonucleoside-diphosphate reductase large subunit n=1 Tax=Suid herpesvirus 1 TaxID=10345 RepID=T2FK93_SUHV|nr:ribonucleotide reductase subunit 1 [Suid alphaherpesvirus 1]AHW49066.1 ribonucleotide reductase subunit 1 [Suid alphaherpesvirus 1]AIT55764.1 ribonucleotide reductase subunit 1 [Suid alphaherpesvirus 1]AJW72258.1 UL39 [Suid alphaherpesvirus 1]AKG93990.1 RR1 [Suid alphaherpesvirus 1]